MRSLVFAIILTLFCNHCFCQQERHQSIATGFHLLDLNGEQLKTFLQNSGYEPYSQQGNRHTFTKTFGGMGYSLTIVFRENRVTVVSWDEIMTNYNSSIISSEINSLQDLGFTRKVYDRYNGGEMRTYESIKRNLYLAITLQNDGTASIMVSLKNINLPHTSLKTAINKSVNPAKPKWIVKSDSYCSPKSRLSKVLSKPDPKAIHAGWKGQKLPAGCFFYVDKRITNANGIFYSGELTYSDGTGDGRGPYFILASEWDSKDIHYEK